VLTTPVATDLSREVEPDDLEEVVQDLARFMTRWDARQYSIVEDMLACINAHDVTASLDEALLLIRMALWPDVKYAFVRDTVQSCETAVAAARREKRQHGFGQDESLEISSAGRESASYNPGVDQAALDGLRYGDEQQDGFFPVGQITSRSGHLPLGDADAAASRDRVAAEKLLTASEKKIEQKTQPKAGRGSTFTDAFGASAARREPVVKSLPRNARTAKSTGVLRDGALSLSVNLELMLTKDNKRLTRGLVAQVATNGSSFTRFVEGWQMRLYEITLASRTAKTIDLDWYDAHDTLVSALFDPEALPEKYWDLSALPFYAALPPTPMPSRLLLYSYCAPSGVLLSVFSAFARQLRRDAMVTGLG
jgi:hypothetical protein